jgi:hypothetical protein
MKTCSANKKTHNLNINMYSFRELLELFQLTSNISLEDLKKAKMMVLRMHPDKSRLPPDYFLFYKKAFDLVVKYYNENTKTSVEVPTTEQTYVPLNEGNADRKTAESIEKTMKDMGADKFQNKFNELFENMVADNRPKSTVNDWFKTNDPLFEFDDVKSTGGLAAAMDHIKSKSAALVRYNGVETMNSGGPSYGNLYDPEDDGAYVSCDPFSKLKFDDLRKVHKDQTVLAVSERDYEKVQKYNSMDHLQRERGSLQVQHVDRSEHERFFEEQQQVLKERMAAKQHQASLKSLEYAEKNKGVMAQFLRLTER